MKRARLSVPFLSQRGFAALLLLAGVAVAQAQTTGIITTRPACVPPNGGADALNYLQGADPILLQNGDVAVMVNAGRCCTGPWEGIFSLIYPAAGRAATPRFSGIWATDDWATDTSRGEAEVGYPSAILYGGKWRVAYTATFRPWTMPNRDRLARLDLDNLTYRAVPSQVTNKWIKPIDPNCQQLGVCTGNGSGVLGTFVLHPGGELYVYHPDGNYPACASGWVRHRINSNMTVANPAGDGCLSFGGQAPQTWLSDIARGADGKLYMLMNSPDFRAIEEWVSTGTASTIGLDWAKTGRRWLRPTNPPPGEEYVVWDAGYLKDQNRQIVEPKVVVSSISSGKTWDEMMDVQLGKWYLHYWADPGAPLPPLFGGEASSCAFGGAHELANCSSIAGWAWDPKFPNSPISVDIFDGSTLLATVPANLYRQDLFNAGKGDGRHGFSWPVPASLKNGASHSISVKFAGTQTNLPGSPRTITCATYALTVSKAGTGSGTVASSPAGISCGTDCSQNYSSGTVVNLTASAAAGSTFVSWSGHADCVDGSVTMTAARSCTATFNSAGPTSVTVQVTPSQTGFLSADGGAAPAFSPSTAVIASSTNTDGKWWAQLDYKGVVGWNVFSAAGAENAPLVTITVSGLVDGQVYSVYGRYVSNAVSSDFFGIRMGLSATGLTEYSNSSSGSQVIASSGNWRQREVLLGTAIVASGGIRLYIDDNTTTGTCAWLGVRLVRQ